MKMGVDDRLREAWRAMQDQNQSGSAADAEPAVPLQQGGGGGTSPPMVPIKDYVDKADEALESRVNAKLDKLATKGTIWGAIATLLGILLAVMALATNRFDSGMSVRSAVDGVMTEQHARDQRQDAKLDEILKRLPPKK